MKTPLSPAPLLPAGHIQRWMNIKGTSTRDLPDDYPVLTAPNARLDPHLTMQGTCLGTGSIQCDDISLLTIRFQAGDYQCYWAADPSEAQVWEMFERWTRSNLAMLLLPSTLGGQVAILPMPGIAGIGRPTRLQLHGTPVATPGQLATAAAKLLVTGHLQRGATSDLPDVSHLKRVDACALCTPKMDQGMQALNLDDVAPTAMKSLLCESEPRV